MNKEMINLPADFEVYTRRLLGEKAYARFYDALQRMKPMSTRLNAFKFPPKMLDKANVGDYAPIPWCNTGCFVKNDFIFTFDPLFNAGCYYVQESSSMFLEQVLRTYVKNPVVMLDLCAAPGGKTTHALSLLPGGSLMVANEVNRNRASVLVENVIKWGKASVMVTCNEAADFQQFPSLFDVVLADVPCSGEGMFRKDPASIEEWSRANVLACSARQRRIISDMWVALKPGGLLIYGTCTYNTDENEANVAWMQQEFGAEVLEVPVEKSWCITGNLAGEDFPVYRFLPHRTPGEGFFMAVLRKPGSVGDVPSAAVSAKKMKKKERKPVNSVPITNECKNQLLHPNGYVWSSNNGRVVAFPFQYNALYERFLNCMQVLHAGITIGEYKGNNFIPHQSLAMCLDLNVKSFPQVNLSYEWTVGYLRGDVLTLKSNMPPGYLLVLFRGIPLGFVKNIGPRANNLYPSPWRIRTSRTPDQEYILY